MADNDQEMMTGGENEDIVTGETNPQTDAGPQVAANGQQEPEAAQQTQRRPKHPCVACRKNVTGASVKCTMCTMWCHKPCTGLSAEAYRGLEIQSKEVGVAYWACRACLSFATKVNRQLQESSKRQDEIAVRVEQNTGGVRQNAQDIESLRQEMRRMQARMEDEREARETALCKELRDRELRRLNLIMHGIPEPAQNIQENRARAEADRRQCGEVLATIGVRTRGQDLKFCRRVGERGRDPRPVVIGIRTEEERRYIMDRARMLQGTRFENVAIVPDLTKMQRRAEDNFRRGRNQKSQPDSRG
jgi:hypothetical protein